MRVLTAETATVLATCNQRVKVNTPEFLLMKMSEWGEQLSRTAESQLINVAIRRQTENPPVIMEVLGLL